jgi:hypothetical protein
MIKGTLSKVSAISLSWFKVDLKTGRLEYEADLLNTKDEVVGKCTEKELPIYLVDEMYTFSNLVEEKIGSHFFEEYEKEEEEIETPQSNEITYKAYGSL